jgi:hypothetical protein
MPCVDKTNLRSKGNEVYIINLSLKAYYLCSDVHMRSRDHNSIDHNVEVLITCNLNYFVYAVVRFLLSRALHLSQKSNVAMRMVSRRQIYIH